MHERLEDRRMARLKRIVGGPVGEIAESLTQMFGGDFLPSLMNSLDLGLLHNRVSCTRNRHPCTMLLGHRPLRINSFLTVALGRLSLISGILMHFLVSLIGHDRNLDISLFLSHHVDHSKKANSRASDIYSQPSGHSRC